MATRTHTVYFSERAPDVVKLREAYHSMREDATSRRPHITTEAYEAMNARIDLLGAAITLLVEPVPPSYGG